ncbi:MAG: histidine kinase [Gordonia sp. (in: high G+C Gram-positive bacteria)]|uniref:sensor histidine kinase n=1 Tax=Gordonia sp. (in: high G+C Gram-positive bacteria) TaxID=84139 RepID=UPI0039E30599
MHDPLALPSTHRSTVAFDVLAAGLFGLLTIPAQTRESTFAAGVTAVIALAIAVRNLSPSTMIGLALGTAAVQVATLQIALLGAIGYAPLFAVAGSHPDPRVRRGSLAVGGVGVPIAGAVLPATFPDGTSVFYPVLLGITGAAVVVLGGWTFGFTRYQRRSVEQARVAETVAELERRRLLELYDEQAERSRLARDMHDVVAHSLAVVIAQAEGARFVLASSPETADEALGVIAGTAREALGEVRDVLHELRRDDTPPRADAAERARLVDRMRAAGMTLTVEETGDPESAEPAAVQAAHRILTEALTNVLKHGDLTRPVVVRHDWRDGTSMTVRNAVAAASRPPSTAPGAGHGILGMGERAAAVGGTLRSGPTDDGWALEFTAPPARKGAPS